LPTALKASKPAPVHDILSFDLDKPDWAIFEKFHDKLKDAIKRSPEYAQAAGHGAGQTPAGGFSEDIPF
jgi:hypothetical protein